MSDDRGARWVWDPASGRYCWWNGRAYTTWATPAEDSWTYSTTRGVASMHVTRFAIAAAVALGGLVLAFGALISGTDPGPGESPDTGALSAVLIAGGVIFIIGAVVAAVELVRSLRPSGGRR
jgi:hypothetical protein